MPSTLKSTTARGLGWEHQKRAAKLKRTHVDGTLCWWCDRPMFLEGARNWDQRSLAADHSHPRSMGGTHADRLMHDTCNKSRGDGSRDHSRPALGGRAMTRPVALERLAMDW